MKKLLTLLIFSWCYISLLAQTTKTNHRDWIRTDGNTGIALVIGNSKYQHSVPIREPANDANTIADALKSQGYDVVLGYNLEKDKLYDAVDNFAQKLKSYQEAIVFYAGHGFQVDANPMNKAQVRRYCMDVNYILQQINSPEKPKLILMDACRNNPFARSWTPSETRNLGLGMASISALENSLVVFSTAENTTVSDYNQFAEILARKIKSGGCLQGSIIGEVSKEVKRNNAQQLIRPSGWLLDDMCFGTQVFSKPTSSQQTQPTKVTTRPPDPIPEGMLLVEGGEFMMGCTPEQGECEDDEKPVHKVYVDDFLMGEHEVTNEEFVAFLNSEGNRSEGGREWYEIVSSAAKIEKQGSYYRVKSGYESHPVMKVSWYGAVAYCKWLSKSTGREYRLPTEAEWEYAARGGRYAEGYKYSGGNNLDYEAWYTSNSGGGTRPVMGKMPNDLDLCDMSGNVWEWCSDWYGTYKSAYQRNPTGASGGSIRVVRGGSWYGIARGCRVAIRNGFDSTSRNSRVGFRVVASPV